MFNCNATCVYHVLCLSGILVCLCREILVVFPGQVGHCFACIHCLWSVGWVLVRGRWSGHYMHRDHWEMGLWVVSRIYSEHFQVMVPVAIDVASLVGKYLEAVFCRLSSLMYSPHTGLLLSHCFVPFLQGISAFFHRVM